VIGPFLPGPITCLVLISNDLRALHGDQPSPHHSPELRQEFLDRIWSVHDLHDHRQVERKPQDVRVMEMMGTAKSHRTAQYRSTGKLQLPGPMHDHLVKRATLVLVGLSDKDTE